MPTGYTAYIEDGSITTGKEFLKLCSRAFGVAIELKEEPLSVPTPEYVEPDSYYKDKYTKAVANLNAALSMTAEEAREKMRQSHEESVTHAKSYLTTLEEKNRLYASVREQVESWLPPTKDYVLIGFNQLLSKMLFGGEFNGMWLDHTVDQLWKVKQQVGQKKH